MFPKDIGVTYRLPAQRVCPAGDPATYIVRSNVKISLIRYTIASFALWSRETVNFAHHYYYSTP